MNHNLWHSTQRCASKPPLLISRVQQKGMGSGQPYMKSGVFSRLKHTLLHGRVPVWAFLLVAGLLLLRLVQQDPTINLSKGNPGPDLGTLFYAPQNGSRLNYVMNTCSPDQELVARQETFLPAGEFDALKGAVLGELEVRSRFKPPGATRCLFCIHVIFNTAGVRKLQSHPKLAAVFPYFQRARLPDANVFDISVTMVEPQALTDRAAYSPHWDTTLTQHMAKRASIAGMTVSREWTYGMLSDTSDVIYLQVPQDMQGGQFRIWDPRRYDWRILQSAELPPPSEQFELKENMRVQFRGDALHALDGFQSSLRLPRVSLVVKQYKVSAGDYAFAPEWVQAA